VTTILKILRRINRPKFMHLKQYCGKSGPKIYTIWIWMSSPLGLVLHSIQYSKIVTSGIIVHINYRMLLLALVAMQCIWFRMYIKARINRHISHAQSLRTIQQSTIYYIPLDLINSDNSKGKE